MRMLILALVLGCVALAAAPAAQACPDHYTYSGYSYPSNYSYSSWGYPMRTSYYSGYNYPGYRTYHPSTYYYPAYSSYYPSYTWGPRANFGMYAR